VEGAERPTYALRVAESAKETQDAKPWHAT
jgi:tRNA 2-thiouridine synthesizing protein A